MQNFNIHFSYPWLLLLLIPAVALTLIPYFRLSKRYRRTRNRIVSIVLHLIVMLLAITTLAGIEFRYEIPNDKNEIILLVDMSDSEEVSNAERDEFVQTVLKDSKFDNYNVGIVTFGFDQQYAVPITTDIDSIYNDYLAAPLPDTSATNIKAALEYAQTLFESPETGKIVLITDGKETDEDALEGIRTTVAQGITVDTAFVPSDYEGEDVQLVEVVLPDYHIGLNEECDITLTLKSEVETSATIEMYDNDELDEESTQSVEISEGTQSVVFKHTFTEEGLHELYFTLDIDDDGVKQNNMYYSYLYLEQFNEVLIVQRESGESEALVDMLNDGLGEEEMYDITVKTITDEDFPNTLDELRAYDQIILNNISNEELTAVSMDDESESFDVILEKYVKECGGGLFTVGGNNDQGEANAYSRSDMYGTLYQSMLPVEAIDYTPPVGVVVIIDRSGSMTGVDDYGQSFLEGAKAGALACLDALTERDYIGIMTLDSVYSTILPLTPRTQESKIRDAVASIEEANGNTVFASAIQQAGLQLRNLKAVDKRHMIIVTDGLVGDREAYEGFIKEYYETDGTTLSIVGVGMTENSQAAQQMQEAVDLANGRLHVVRNTKQLVEDMREDLNAPEIEEVNDEPFYPTVYNAVSTLVQGLERLEDSRNQLTMELGGFYGVKARASADLVLVGAYDVPIYAQWKYGQGMVGSFMCDLQSSEWSSEFMSNENGQQFIRNVVNNLMPTQSIRPNEFDYTLKEDNYTNELSIYADLNEDAGEYIKGELIQKKDTGDVVISLNEVKESVEGATFYVKSALSADNHYSRCSFIVKEGGIYELVLTKCDAAGNELAKVTTFKAFSYSEEYNVFLDVMPEELQEVVADMAEKGNGSAIADLEDPWEIFKDFITELSYSFDPRMLFMILAIILFLTDIAVRKFKFKWPHEIIRDYKNKKASK